MKKLACIFFATLIASCADSKKETDNETSRESTAPAKFTLKCDSSSLISVDSEGQEIISKVVECDTLWEAGTSK